MERGGFEQKPGDAWRHQQRLRETRFTKRSECDIWEEPFSPLRKPNLIGVIIGPIHNLCSTWRRPLTGCFCCPPSDTNRTAGVDCMCPPERLAETYEHKFALMNPLLCLFCHQLDVRRKQKAGFITEHWALSASLWQHKELLPFVLMLSQSDTQSGATCCLVWQICRDYIMEGKCCVLWVMILIVCNRGFRNTLYLFVVQKPEQSDQNNFESFKIRYCVSDWSSV